MSSSVKLGVGMLQCNFLLIYEPEGRVVGFLGQYFASFICQQIFAMLL
jgi:hypothetical protein